MSSRPTKRHQNRKNFIILPILFCLLGYLIIAAVLYPIVSPFKDTLGMVFMDKPMVVTEDYKTLFDPAKPQNVEVDQISIADITLPQYGDAFGKITVDNTNVDATVFFGDGDKQLKDGVGMYNGSSFPGMEGTSLLAAHNNTYFNGLKTAEIGGLIHIDTNYGQYVYKITDMKPEPGDSFDLYKQTADVVLYTCYPFDMLGLTPTRYFVYGSFVSGPIVIENGSGG